MKQKNEKIIAMIYRISRHRMVIGMLILALLAGQANIFTLLTRTDYDTVVAAELDNAKEVIASFTGLPDEIARQTVPVGTEQEELVLPDILEAVCVMEDEEDGSDNRQEADSDRDSDSEQETGIDTEDASEDQPDQDAADVKTEEDAEDSADESKESAEKASEPESDERDSSDEAEQTETVAVVAPVYQAEHAVDLEIKTLEKKLDPENAETSGKAILIENITWQSEPEYDKDMAGEYIFTAVLPEGYELAGGVSMPRITVEVREAIEDEEVLRVQAMPLAEEDGIYLDWDDTAKKLIEKPIPGDAKRIDNENMIDWKAEDGTDEVWYIVDEEIAIEDRITVSGKVHLILKNGCRLDARAGITVTEGDTLIIYAQTEDENTAGTLTAVVNDNGISDAGIGGVGGDNGNSAGGKVIINGGNVSATGGTNNSGTGAGIGGGGSSNGTGGAGGAVIINGGNVSATGGGSANSYSGGAGIGGGGGYGKEGGAGGTVTINGGKVIATSGKSDNNGGAGIGGGGGRSEGGAGGTVTVNGGQVTAESQGHGAGIGGGSGNAAGAGGTVTIKDSKVEAISTSGRGAGIGGGGISFSGSINSGGAGGTIEIRGSADVTAKGGDGAGIGPGNNGTEATIKISGGKVAAEGKGGIRGDDITIEDGNVEATGTSGSGAGIDVINSSSSLIISGSAEVTATGYSVWSSSTLGTCAPGIKGNGGTITIAGGRVTATTAYGNCGINLSSGGTLKVEGGEVTARSGTVSSSGADRHSGDAIGFMCGASSRTGRIIITGGTVTAIDNGNKCASGDTMSSFGVSPEFGEEYVHMTYGNTGNTETQNPVEWTGNPSDDWSGWRYVKIQPMTINSEKLTISPDSAEVTLDGTKDGTVVLDKVFTAELNITTDGKTQNVNVSDVVTWELKESAEGEYKSGTKIDSYDGKTLTVDRDESMKELTVTGKCPDNYSGEATVKIIQPQYEVTFKLNNGGADITESISRYDTVRAHVPDVIYKGYRLEGWYTDSNFAEESRYDLDDQVTDEITLYAKWTEADYRITVLPSSNGKVETDKSTAHYNDTVTLTVTPDYDCILAEDGLIVTGTDSKTVAVMPGVKENEYTFVMPDSDVTVSARFLSTKAAGITLDQAAMDLAYKENGTLTAVTDPKDVLSTVTWGVYPEGIVKVDEIADSEGKQVTVTAQQVGEATIMAAVDGHSAICKVTVRKADPDVPVHRGLTAVYGDTLADVVGLQNGFAWADPGERVGKVGTHEFDATYTSDDPSYNTVQVKISVTVEKAFLSIGAPSATYNGSTVFPVKVDGAYGEKVDVEYTTAGKDVGNYEYNKDGGEGTYRLSVQDDNYKLLDAYGTLTINPLPVELRWSSPDSFTYDGKEHSVTAEVSNKVNGDTFSLSYTDNIAKDVGSYTAAVTELGNDNYTLDGGSNVTKAWSIKKASGNRGGGSSSGGGTDSGTDNTDNGSDGGNSSSGGNTGAGGGSDSSATGSNNTDTATPSGGGDKTGSDGSNGDTGSGSNRTGKPEDRKDTADEDGDGDIQVGESGTTVTLPDGGTSEPGEGGTVIVPGGSVVHPGNGGPDITVVEDGGIVSGDGSVTLPGAGSVRVGNARITLPAEGGTVIPGAAGTVTVPAGSTITREGQEPVTVTENGIVYDSRTDIVIFPEEMQETQHEASDDTNNINDERQPAGGTQSMDNDGAEDSASNTALFVILICIMALAAGGGFLFLLRKRRKEK